MLILNFPVYALCSHNDSNNLTIFMFGELCIIMKVFDAFNKHNL